MALLDEVIATHGGSDRWAGATEIVLHASSGGLLTTTKGKRRALARYDARVSTREPRTVVTPYPRPGRRGVFERDRVRIETDAGAVVAERERPRDSFGGLRHALWWDHLDLLYFAGYALWGYANAPFAFTQPGFEVREIDPWEEHGEPRRRLAVTFPPDVPAHSREQVFHVDGEGRLRRNDYTAEVVGSWAKAAHYCDVHREFAGLLFPTRRRVYPRRPDGRARARPTLVWIDLASVDVVEE